MRERIVWVVLFAGVSIAIALAVAGAIAVAANHTVELLDSLMSWIRTEFDVNTS